MVKCRCPKGFPKEREEEYSVFRPTLTSWRVSLRFRVHTGACPLTDELLGEFHADD